MKGRIVTTTDGLDLYVVETGIPTARPILFLHGFSQSSNVWEKQFASPLAEKFRLVAPDLRGHGLSRKPIHSYHDPKGWANDVHSVLTQLQLVNPIVCAWSFGTAVVGDYLQTYGGKHISAFIFISGTPGRDIVGRGWQAIEPKLLLENEDYIKPAVVQFIRYMFASPPPKEVFAKWIENWDRVPFHVRYDILTRPAREKKSLEIDQPVLVIHGDSDQITDVASADKTHLFLSHAQVSIYPNAGHAPFWEWSDKFNNELIKFVNRYEGMEDIP